MNILSRLVLYFLVFISTTTTAYAYLDPVSVSFILQGIIGAIAALLASVRSFRTKISRFFSKLIGSKSKTEDSDEKST